MRSMDSMLRSEQSSSPGEGQGQSRVRVGVRGPESGSSVRVRVGVRVRVRMRVQFGVKERAGANVRVQVRVQVRACGSERARVTDAHSREVGLGIGLLGLHDEPREAFAHCVPQAVFAPPLVSPLHERRLDLQLELEHRRPRFDVE